MSAEQSHGKKFETLLIQGSGLFPLMKDVVLPANSLYDIPETYTNTGIPVSIKTAKYPTSQTASPTLSLADAVRFYDTTTNGSLKMIAGFYTVEDTRSIFSQIFEVTLTQDVIPALWGQLTQEDISLFASYIKYHKNLIGDVPEDIIKLQEDAKNYKAKLLPKCGLISLNPKISAGVGRLQCSIDSLTLYELAEHFNLNYTLYNSEIPYGKIPLPFSLEAGHRSTKNK